MARPRKANIFEVMLPDNLLPNEEWLYEYHRNCLTVVNYLKNNGAKSTAYYGAIKCLCLLREYLLDNNLSYSPDNTDRWLSDNTPLAKGYEITVSRLHDIYQFGSIHPMHAFPFAISYISSLNCYWAQLLSIFSFSLEGSSGQKNILQLTSIAARFLYGIQKRGLVDISQITFDVLEEYCTNDFHESHNTDAKYTYVIGDFFRVMADNGYCRFGLGWYPYYRMHNQIIKINELSSVQRERIEAVRQMSQEFPVTDYANLIPVFLEELKDFNYSKSPIKTSRFVLYNLLLFLDMNNLGYHPVIAEVWLEYSKANWQLSGWKQSRRTICLFNAFTEQNAVAPQRIYRVKQLRCYSLPKWCLEELEPFMLLKKKEGWELSTINMYRSSVTRFCEYLVSAGIDSFQKLTPEMIKTFNRTDIHKTAEAKNAYNSRIRTFLQYLERKEIIRYGMYLSLYSKAAPAENIVTILSDEDKSKIHLFGSFASKPIELRDYAILLIGLLMGLRAVDIVQIKMSDINWKNQSIRILQEKTNYEIELPMPVEVGNAIYKYIKFGRQTTDCSYVFLKNRAPFDAVGPSACRDAIRRILSLPEGIGFHITRRTFATDRLKEEVELQSLIDLMGQRDTSSLHHYLLHQEEKMMLCPISMNEAGIPFRGIRYD